jgi:type II secretory ATPase GspE/PulE/Tfp pilus assembly ATPase PilB-like protein
MNPFVNPNKRSISLPAGCKDLADLLAGPQRAGTSSVRRFIMLLLTLAAQESATELVIGGASESGGGTPIRYKVQGRWYELSPFPSNIRARLVRELGKLAGLRSGQYPQDGILSVPLNERRIAWRIQVAAPAAECVLTTALGAGRNPG